MIEYAGVTFEASKIVPPGMYVVKQDGKVTHIGRIASMGFPVEVKTVHVNEVDFDKLRRMSRDAQKR